ncbi:MAG: ABC transporter ATP-binding protein [Fidelibacterota bacterium]
MLKLRGVETYYGKIKVLQGISLSIHQGQFVTVLGSNGAGKTTLLRTISGVVQAEYGEIVFESQRIEKLDPEDIVRLGVVHVPQGRMIFSELKVVDNLLLGGYTFTQEGSLDEVFNYFPVLKHRLNQYAGTLSGGEQQILAIGRAIMARPKLLLLDEPSLGLAPQLVQEIMEILKRLHKGGLTILLVEQNIHHALKIADYAYVMRNGKIFMSGEPEVILEEEQVRESYLGRGKGKYTRRAKIWGR